MIRLTRRVPVSCFDVQGTVALGRRRPEFLAVARLAADLARPIEAADVLEHLLGPLPPIVGCRVLERCVGLGLLQWTERAGAAALSPSAPLALDQGEVLVPEEGVWRFFVVDDPLISGGVLQVTRLAEASAQQTRRGRPRTERLAPVARVPARLQQACGAPPCLPFGGGPLVQVRALAERGRGGPQGDLHLELVWQEAPELVLRGRLPREGAEEEGAVQEMALPWPAAFASMTRQTLWTWLVAHAARRSPNELERWQRQLGRPVLPVAFSSLTPSERAGFRKNLALPACAPPGLGPFEPADLPGVDLLPATAEDAQQWLAWLQWEALTEHALPEQLEQSARELLPRLLPYTPRPLTPRELLAQARAQRDERSFFVLAPFDLGLWSSP
jgi:hypothetical protein